MDGSEKITSSRHRKKCKTSVFQGHKYVPYQIPLKQEGMDDHQTFIKCSSITRFDDYVLVDTDIAVLGALSDAEIVTLGHNNTESDEDESEELTPVTLSEAKVSLNKLRNFSIQNHVDADILQASFVLEKSIDKLRLNALKQKKKTDFSTKSINYIYDEAHFWLNGYVNKQNCRIWSEANPQVYVETPLHPEKLTVWCASWAVGIIGPYFFKNDEGPNVTVNGDQYRAMITIFFIPELNNHDFQELWFQQEGATCHTARATIDLLKDTF
ncbi:DUF4817 domain-containing protein [Trichonephila clavipes]|nr:DUF4817 domain-containing protein [Trichonephila clavipes]